MLGNEVPLWEVMLAAIKLGAVMIPATTLLAPDDLRDRIERGDVTARRGRAAELAPRFDARARRAASASRSAAAVGGLARASATPTRADATFTPDGPTTADRSAAALLHLRHHLAAQAGAAHPRRATRSGTCRRCTGSACSRATSTSTSPRRAGPSTPGAASSRRGTPAPRSSSTTTPASTRPALLDALRPVRRHHLLRAADGVAHADPGGPDADRACRCARWSAPASRSTRRSSSRCRRPGASPSATATARPRPPRRSATRPGSRSSPARWAGRCRATRSRCSTPTGSRPTRARSASTSPPARSA